MDANTNLKNSFILGAILNIYVLYIYKDDQSLYLLQIISKNRWLLCIYCWAVIWEIPCNFFQMPERILKMK